MSLRQLNSTCWVLTTLQITSVITAAQIRSHHWLISARLTCVVQRCSQSVCGWWLISSWRSLTSDQWHAIMCLYSEGVVEVCIQVTDCNLSVSQAHISWLVANFLSARLACSSTLASLTFNAVGDVCSTSCVFWWAPWEKEFSPRELGGGSHKVFWGRWGR